MLVSMTSPQLEPASSADSPSNDSLPSLPSVDGPAPPVIEICTPPADYSGLNFEMDTTMQEVTQKKYEKSQASEDSEPRHERELKKHGLRPVWTAWDGYPGEMPDDIQKWLGDNGRRGEYTWIFRRVSCSVNYTRFCPAHRAS